MIGAETVPWWTAIVVPVICVFVGGVPWWNEKQKNDKRRLNHERRMEATADAVLGVEADPSIGRPKVRGLKEIVPEIEKGLGTLNSKSVMEHIHDAERRLDVLEAQ